MIKILRKTVAAALSAVAALSMSLAAPAVTTAEDAGAQRPIYEPEFNSMNHYCYELDEPFAVSPDSFEAWIKMPQGSVGGTIMGNFTYPGSGLGGIVDWSVDGFGRVKINWNDGKFKYTFANPALDDNEWHHIAVVRDEVHKAFLLYVDGTLADSATSAAVGAVNAKYSMAVGVGHENYGTPKNPFEGYIRQITIYNGTINADKVKADMQLNEITDDFNGKLMGNWYFGDVWTKRNVKESSGNGNDATLNTFEKYVGVSGDDFEYDYSLAILGDVQAIVNAKPQIFLDMMKWLVDNKESEKIECVIALGDLTDSGVIPVEDLSNPASLERWNLNDVMYGVAEQGFSMLDNKVRYCFVPGNHDYDFMDNGNHAQSQFNKYFPYSKHSTLPGFAGAYIEGDMANTYYTFSVCGVDYLVLNLEYEPRMPVMRWACRICEQHPRHRIIVNTHSYMRAYGDINTTSNLYRKDGVSTSGMELFDGLIKRYENIFMVLCGHVCYDDVVVRTDTGIHGNTITSFMVNPQGVTYDSGLGEDLIFMMNFNEKTGEINCCYYSPYHDATWNIQNQFRLKYWF